MKKIKLVSITFLLLAAGVVYFIGTNGKDPQPLIVSAQTKPTVESEIDKNFPIATWEDPAQARNVDEKRRKKNSRFEGTKWVEKTVYDTDSKSSLITHWQIGLSALPTKKSDVVLIGTVASAEAFLCNDNGSVYSEFSVKIDNILKDRKDSSIKINDHIAVDRAGGRVKYPSGRVFKYEIQGQAMPRLNGRYVLFLTYDKDREMYLIITAYEILDGKIFALDGKGRSPLAGFDFEKYNGMNEFEFLNQVRDSINAQMESKEEIRIP
jgi:hypothetical protein